MCVRYCITVALIFFYEFSCNFALAHIGEPCNSILGVCLPLSDHVFCDTENKCRCKPEYPVVIMPHTCMKPKSVGQRCSHPNECSYLDKNAYCTQTPYSSECRCHEGYKFNSDSKICEIDHKFSGSKQNGHESLLLPSTVGFILACFGLFCCVLFLWHGFCRKQSSTDWSTRMTALATRSSPLNDGEQSPHVIDFSSHNRLHLPGYELPAYDQPPPSYEDAIKNDQVVVATSAGVSSVPKTHEHLA